MENMRAFYSAATVAVILVLILPSSTASAATAPSASTVKTYAYISNCDSDTISVIDTATNTVTSTLKVGDGPFGVTITPDGKKVYVTNVYNGTVSVIDTTINNVIATIKVAGEPEGLAVTPDGSKVYVVGAANSGIVSVINTATDAVIATVNVGQWPGRIAITPDGTKVYVTNQISGTVSVIDTSKNIVTSTLSVLTPGGLAVTPDGTKVYVLNNTNKISIIDTATNTVTATLDIANNLNEIAFNHVGTIVYLPGGYKDTVSAVDTKTNTIISTVPVGTDPCGIAVTPDGTKAYVANYGSNDVSVIDTATNTVVATVPVGSNPIALGQFIGSVPTLAPLKTPTITWNTPADITSGTAVSSEQLNAIATDPNTGDNVPGTFVYTLTDGTSATGAVLDVGTHILYVDFTPSDALNYNTASKEVTINVLEKPAVPVADFWASPTVGKPSMKVQFTDMSTGVPTSWFWDFGDKSISTEKNPVHQYTRAGKYAVSLTVKNALGSNTKKISHYIKVSR